jgi:hypothetical protein
MEDEKKIKELERIIQTLMEDKESLLFKNSLNNEAEFRYLILLGLEKINRSILTLSESKPVEKEEIQVEDSIGEEEEEKSYIQEPPNRNLKPSDVPLKKAKPNAEAKIYEDLEDIDDEDDELEEDDDEDEEDTPAPMPRTVKSIPKPPVQESRFPKRVRV